MTPESRPDLQWRSYPEEWMKEKPMTTLPNLTLYSIETQLLELLIFRDSVLEDPDLTPADQKDSLEAIDRQIQEYVSAEVRKCDGIAHYLREFEKRAEAEAEEIERLKARKQMWEKRHETLEKLVISIMQQTGKTRIDGVHNVLSLRKNPLSVEVVQPDLVPEEYQRYVLAITGTTLRVIIDAMAKDQKLLSVYGVEPKGEPAKATIAKRLKEGDGVPGCRLKTDGVSLEVR